MAISIPAMLADRCRNDPHTSEWLAHLPELIIDLQHRWSLKLGSPFQTQEGSCAWVAPATLPCGTNAVLKIGMPHLEAEQEIDGLRFWNGDPTVLLFNWDDEAGAMLLERCDPGTSLRALAEPEQDVVIARLLRRLWRPLPAKHAFRHLSVMTAYWRDETLRQAKRWGDSGLVSAGLQTLKDLSRSATTDLLLATDLHAGNILRAQREPWIVIDPKPFVGDPAYDASQHLLNCSDRLRSDPHATIHRFADLLNVNPERVRLWLFGRAAAEPRTGWKDDALSTLARVLAP